MRLDFIDALRGLAILLVFLFHAYARWPEVVPYGNQFAKVPLFAFGWLGVQLFFLISGFVILMTLEKSAGPIDFLKRRWLRLFPAMLICSLVVYATSPLFPFRPAGVIHLRDLVPGLTFIEPLWWGTVFRSPQGVIEGAFWSLYVEVKFYIVACLLFFVIGGRNLILVLVAIFLTGWGLSHLSSVAGRPLLHVEVDSMRQFGWFAAGALFYRYFHERRTALLWWAVGLSIAAAWSTCGRDLEVGAAALLVVFLFTSAVCFPLFQRLLSIKPLLLMGAASYPFYLIHENMSVSMIVQSGQMAPWMPRAMLPLVPFLVVLLGAFLIARFLEPKVRKSIKTAGRQMRYQRAVKAVSKRRIQFRVVERSACGENKPKAAFWPCSPFRQRFGHAVGLASIDPMPAVLRTTSMPADTGDNAPRNQDDPTQTTVRFSPAATTRDCRKGDAR